MRTTGLFLPKHRCSRSENQLSKLGSTLALSPSRSTRRSYPSDVLGSPSVFKLSQKLTNRPQSRRGCSFQNFSYKNARHLNLIGGVHPSRHNHGLQRIHDLKSTRFADFLSFFCSARTKRSFENETPAGRCPNEADDYCPKSALSLLTDSIYLILFIFHPLPSVCALGAACMSGPCSSTPARPCPG